MPRLTILLLSLAVSTARSEAASNAEAAAPDALLLWHVCPTSRTFPVIRAKRTFSVGIFVFSDGAPLESCTIDLAFADEAQNESGQLFSLPGVKAE